MMLALPEIQTCFQIDNVSYVNTLIVENRSLFFKITSDIFSQTEGEDGLSVLSDKGKIIDIAKNLEIIDNFLTFDLNKKPLLNKIIAALEKVAVDEVHYLKTQKLLAEIEAALYDWSFAMPCGIVAAKLSPAVLLKALGIEIANDYTGSKGVLEKLLDYMELVREFDRNKLFFLINMRAFFDDNEVTLFLQTATQHQFYLFLLDNKDYKRLPMEKRLVVDEDLCEIDG